MQSSTARGVGKRPQRSHRLQPGCSFPSFPARLLSCLTAGFLLAGGVSGRVLAAVINVPADQSTIQSGIDAAAASGDEIVVAPGTYHEVINFNGKAVNLRSSAGAATTIIDGTDAITGFPLGGSVVFCANGEGPGTILDGFTVTGGHVGTVVGGAAYGLGVYIAASGSPVIKNCIIRDNMNGNTATFGAGLVSSGGSPVISNCQFVNNALGTAQNTSGGGISLYGGSAVVTDCTFTGNVAKQGGGIICNGAVNASISGCSFGENIARDGAGMMCLGGAATITDCAFTNNTASLGVPSNTGGGGVQTVNSETTISNCLFSGNHAAYGAGVFMNHGDTILYPSPAILNCSFQNNVSTNPGAGVSIRSSKPLVTGCTFEGNTTTSYGGGLYSEKAGPIVANCLFKHNTGGAGGGIAMAQNGSVPQVYFPTIVNCTIVENVVTVTNRGAGIEIAQDVIWAISPARISNCIVRGNTGAAGFTNIRFPTSVLPGWVTLQYSDVQGPVFGQYIGSHNIDADPLFVDAPNGDYHVLQASPCIEAGYDWAVPENVKTDFDGDPRFQDGDGDHVTWVDIGAFEYPEERPGKPGVYAPDPVAFWSFNDTAIAGSAFPADVGSGTLSTSSWGGVIEPGYGAFFDINQLWHIPAGVSLQLDNGSGGNGTSIEMAFSMTGYEGLVVTFVTARSDSNSFNNGSWSWSTDGRTFTTVPGVNTCPSSLPAPWSALQTVDLSAVTALDDAPSVKLRYTLSGAVGADRNVTIDNLQLNATVIPQPPSNPADITGDGIVDIDDLFAVINAWGPCPDPQNCPADVSPVGPPQGDDVVDIDDLFTVINNWS